MRIGAVRLRDASYMAFSLSNVTTPDNRIAISGFYSGGETMSLNMRGGLRGSGTAGNIIAKAAAAHFATSTVTTFFKAAPLMLGVIGVSSLVGGASYTSTRTEVIPVLYEQDACGNDVSKSNGVDSISADAEYSGEVITVADIEACANRQEYLDLVTPTYQFYCKKYGIKFPGILALQGIWEAGVPTTISTVMRQDNNMGGLKYSPSQPHAQRGGPVPSNETGGNYSHFNNMTEYIEAAVWTIANEASPYGTAMQYKDSDITKFTRALCSMWVEGNEPGSLDVGYAYSEELLEGYKEYGLSKYEVESAGSSSSGSRSSSGSGSSGSSSSASTAGKVVNTKTGNYVVSPLDPTSIKKKEKSSFCHGDMPADKVKYIVLHDTQGKTDAASTIIDAMDANGNGVPHFVIDKSGTVYGLVPINKITHHAAPANEGANGTFSIEEERDDKKDIELDEEKQDYAMNAWSIGISLVHDSGNYPAEQLNALDSLIAYIDKQVGSKPSIITHKEWATDKTDCDSTLPIGKYKESRNHVGNSGDVQIATATAEEEDPCGEPIEEASGESVPGGQKIAEAAVQLAGGTADDSWTISPNSHTKPTDEHYSLFCQKREELFPDSDHYYWASCDVSVATAIRMSGADPAFPEYLGYQIKYVEEQPDLWAKVGTYSQGDTEEKFQPGDVLINSSHIYLYVGNDAVKQKFPSSNANVYHGSNNGEGQSKLPRVYYEETCPASKTFDIYRSKVMIGGAGNASSSNIPDKMTFKNLAEGYCPAPDTVEAYMGRIGSWEGNVNVENGIRSLGVIGDVKKICDFYDAKGGYTDAAGFERIRDLGDCYIVAIGEFPYAASGFDRVRVGDMVTLGYDDGTTIKAIVGDHKGWYYEGHNVDPTDSNSWTNIYWEHDPQGRDGWGTAWGHGPFQSGTDWDINIVEFWGSDSTGNPMAGALQKSTGKNMTRLVSVVNEGMSPEFAAF
jgi:N-acetyl-anhydromuramyl-L-alanine amidase AmpD